MLQDIHKKDIINFPVNTGKYQSFVDKITDLASAGQSSAVYFANVHMYIEAYKNKSFLEQISNAEIVAPDGQPIVWAFKILYKISQDRVAGMDVFPDLLKRMEKERLPVYFYGGTQEMLDKTEVYVKREYPNLPVAGLYSPPFRPLTEQEQVEIVTKINVAAPAITFVFLGCPQQEKWVAAMKGKVNGVMAAIGGALPVAIGIQKRAPEWMRNFGLEWLFRFSQEPRRLFKRYLTTNSLFIWVIFKEFIRLRLLVPLRLAKK